MHDGDILEKIPDVLMCEKEQDLPKFDLMSQYGIENSVNIRCLILENHSTPFTTVNDHRMNLVEAHRLAFFMPARCLRNFINDQINGFRSIVPPVVRAKNN